MVKMNQRYLDILRLTADGLTNKEIGNQLGTTKRTIGASKTRIFVKLGALNSPHAIAIAFREGLLE